MVLPDPDLAPALAEDLAAAGYTPDLDFLTDEARAALKREQPALALVETATSDHPAAVLTRLFALGAPVDVHAAEQALARCGGVVEATVGGLVAVGSDGVRGVIDIDPLTFGNELLWFASDPGEIALGGPLPEHHVLGVGGASQTLADITIRDPRRRVLDLGTGCGIQAITATRHAQAVIGTDISQRALAFAGFNARLNGAAIELREGDLYQPVAGEKFDHIIANPPFVIDAPTEVRHEYRDAGRPGDAIMAELARNVIHHLEPGGVAQFLGNWERHRGEHFSERWHGWIAEHDLDAWVVEREVLDPGEYAEMWLRDAGYQRSQHAEFFDAMIQQWVSSLREREVEAIGFGYVLLRAPGGAGHCTEVDRLRRFEEHTGSVTYPIGEVFSKGLAAHDWLARHHDLREAHLTVAPDVTQESYYTPGAEDPQVVILRQGGGFGRALQVSGAVAGIVGACDGELPLGAIMSAVGELLGDPEVTAYAMPVLRRLIADGILLPAASPN